jgi:hypothetical protein
MLCRISNQLLRQSYPAVRRRKQFSLIEGLSPGDITASLARSLVPWIQSPLASGNYHYHLERAHLNPDYGSLVPRSARFPLPATTGISTAIEARPLAMQCSSRAIPQGMQDGEIDSLMTKPGVASTASSQRLLDDTSGRVSQRQIHWRTPRLLVASFIAGLVATFSQHFLYTFLHHRAEDRENFKTGLVLCGRALAYLAKVAFAQCIILCYRQRIWRTFRDRLMTVRAIDQMFSGTEDVSLLVNWEVICNAPFAVAMVMVVWLLPLATVIASPSALTFEWRPEVSEHLVSVPTLNFFAESYFDFREPQDLPDGSYRKSIVIYNSTDISGKKPGWFDFFDVASSVTRSLFWQSIYSTSKNVMDNTFDQEVARYRFCGGNYNCTYTISFLGPGYKCQDVTDQPGGLFNTSVLVPEGLNYYHADVDTGDYAHPQFENMESNGIPIGDIPDHVGDFRFEPELWIGWSYRTNKSLPADSPLFQPWVFEYEQHIGRCIHYETNYTVDFNFTGRSVHIQPSSQFIAPILGFDFTQRNDGVLPVDRWLSPRDHKEAYKKTAAYHALGQVFREIIGGNITYSLRDGPNFITASSEVTNTSLLQKDYRPVSDILERLENLYQGIVLTFLTRENLVINSEKKVLVQRSRYRIAFVYNSVRLWICYAPVIVLTLAILLMGAWTIWEDGTTFSTGFSRILVTSRNPTLDEISRGACLGNDPFPEELMKRKLRFGALRAGTKSGNPGADLVASEGYRHCAFGLPLEVGPIRKDIFYTGLQVLERSSGRLKEKIE